jgi:hypothetical protein
MTKLTQRVLHEMLDYDKDSGIFIWKVRSAQRIRIGDIAGSVVAKGYIGIKLLGKRYLAHRLAWLYVNGEFPDGFVDHANTVRTDNRINNLRLCTRQENKRNGKLYKNNTSGFRGVEFKNNGWEGSLRVGDQIVYVGRFKTAVEASTAVEKQAEKIHSLFYRNPHVA